MIRKIFKRKESSHEIKLIAILLGIGNISAFINSGIIDFSLLVFIGEAAIVSTAVFFLIKLSKEYKTFVKKNQTA